MPYTVAEELNTIRLQPNSAMTWQRVTVPPTLFS